MKKPLIPAPYAASVMQSFNILVPGFVHIIEKAVLYDGPVLLPEPQCIMKYPKMVSLAFNDKTQIQFSIFLAQSCMHALWINWIHCYKSVDM